MKHLIERFRVIRPIEAFDIIDVVVSIIGLALNLLLLSTNFLSHCCRRGKPASARDVNQRCFIAILAFAHIVLCSAEIAEFVIKAYKLLDQWLIGFQFLKRRFVINLCDLFIIGSVLACAIDNYIAVCFPSFHMFERSRIKKVFAFSLAVYLVAVTVVALFDFLLPVYIDIESCPQAAGEYLSTSDSAANSQLVVPALFIIRSAKDFNSYCYLLQDCQLTNPLTEWTVFIVWIMSTLLNCYFYIRIIVVLRNSHKKLFMHLSLRQQQSLSEKFRSAFRRVLPSNKKRKTEENICSSKSDVLLTVSSSSQPEQKLKPTKSESALHELRLNFPPNVEGIELLSSHATASPDMLSPRSAAFFTSSFTSLGELSARTHTGRSCIKNSATSNKQSLHVYRSRRRASLTMMAILVAFIITWSPTVSFEVANALFFDKVRVDVLPLFMPFIPYFHFLLLLNAIVDPVIYCYGIRQKVTRLYNFARRMSGLSET